MFKFFINSFSGPRSKAGSTDLLTWQPYQKLPPDLASQKSWKMYLKMSSKLFLKNTMTSEVFLFRQKLDQQIICSSFHRWVNSESEKYDIEYNVKVRDMQIHQLEMEVTDMRGKFILPKLKKVHNFKLMGGEEWWDTFFLPSFHHKSNNKMMPAPKKVTAVKCQSNDLTNYLF